MCPAGSNTGCAHAVLDFDLSLAHEADCLNLRYNSRDSKPGLYLSLGTWDEDNGEDARYIGYRIQR